MQEGAAANFFLLASSKRGLAFGGGSAGRARSAGSAGQDRRRERLITSNDAMSRKPRLALFRRVWVSHLQTYLLIKG